jgi:hypothetical protein
MFIDHKKLIKELKLSYDMGILTDADIDDIRNCTEEEIQQIADEEISILEAQIENEEFIEKEIELPSISISKIKIESYLPKISVLSEQFYNISKIITQLKKDKLEIEGSNETKRTIASQRAEYTIYRAFQIIDTRKNDLLWDLGELNKSISKEMAPTRKYLRLIKYRQFLDFKYKVSNNFKKLLNQLENEAIELRKAKNRID